MYKLLRKMVPGFIKKRFKNLVHSIINSNENIHRVDQIQNQVHELNKQVGILQEERSKTEKILQEMAGLDKRIARLDQQLWEVFTKYKENLEAIQANALNLQALHTRINIEMTTVGDQIRVLAERIEEDKTISREMLADCQQKIEAAKFYIENNRTHIRQLHSHTFEISPELIPVHIALREKAADFYQQYQAPEVDLSIHKNDLMLLHSWIYRGELTESVIDYLRIGLNQANISRKIIHAYFPGRENTLRFLDFASGYGRATRFLVHYFPSEHITVSDIKHASVDFQEKVFGVKGIYSYDDPEKFNPEGRYDFIFVGSLFSHLPELYFMQWLRVLTLCLEENGILAITVHDQEIGEGKQGITYHAQSEDSEYSYVTDAIEDTEIYGVTYVDETYIKSCLQQLTQKYYYQRFPKLFGQVQDVYLISARELKQEIKEIWNFP